MSKTRILSFVPFYLLLATFALAYVWVHFCGSNANNIVFRPFRLSPFCLRLLSQVTDSG